MSNKQKAEEIFKGMMIKPPYHQYQIIGAMEHIAEWKEQQIKEERKLLVNWFEHIAQIATDRKTANGVVMKDCAALDEIAVLAKDSINYLKECTK